MCCLTVHRLEALNLPCSLESFATCDKLVLAEGKLYILEWFCHTGVNVYFNSRVPDPHGPH
jgi:hypothetical protein